MWFLMLAMLSCAHEPMPEPSPACLDAERTWLSTEDGATIHLHRHAAAGPPVVLVHGIASNHRAWDLGPGRSLARSLQGAGFDTWLLDLRGHGDARWGPGGARHRRGASLDTYATQDFVTAFAHIRSATGHAELGFVGHSLGGMILAAHQAIHGDAHLGAVVVVASPLEFEEDDELMRLARPAMRLGSLFPRINLPMVARTTAALRPQPLGVESVVINVDNLAPEARAEAWAQITSPLYREELAQLRHSLEGGHFASADGTVDYVAALADFETPLLVIAGGGDRVAPPAHVQPWMQAASPDKLFVRASRDQGFTHDYGHVDLCIGDTAEAEIHPHILGWMRAHLSTDPP